MNQPAMSHHCHCRHDCDRHHLRTGPGPHHIPTLLSTIVHPSIKCHSCIDHICLATATLITRPWFTCRYCREYATLRESSLIRTVVVCDGDKSTKHTYITESNYVEIEVEKFGQTDTTYRFLLRYDGKKNTSSVMLISYRLPG